MANSALFFRFILVVALILSLIKAVKAAIDSVQNGVVQHQTALPQLAK